MAFIEDKIFRSLSFSRVEITPLLRALLSYIADLHRLGTRPVFVDSDIERSRGVVCFMPSGFPILYLNWSPIPSGMPFLMERMEPISLKMSKNKDAYHLSVRDDGIRISDSKPHPPGRKTGKLVIEELIRRLEGEYSMSRNRRDRLGHSFSLRKQWKKNAD